MRVRHFITMITVAALAASTVVVGAATASAATTDVVVRPGACTVGRWSFTDSVRPGFVTGPAKSPLGGGFVPVRHRRPRGPRPLAPRWS